MIFDYREQLPEEFDTNSRVWIYQASRLFSDTEARWIEENLKQFTASWLSHGHKVTAYGNLFFGHFIILMADETASGVSGCSTDASVHFIKQIEKRFGVALLERQSLAFLNDNKLQFVSISQLNTAFSDGLIHAETLFFNNIVSTKEELLNNWIIPLKDSWLNSRIVYPKAVVK
jgi:hypothetical protein